MLHSLDARSVRMWCVRALDVLVVHRAELDRINVYPVPDGDTGTNLLLTLRAAADELSASAVTDAGQALRAMARGAVLGARGNSGVIVSQFLRGLAEELAGCVEVDGSAVALALGRADRLAWAAVDDPVEGTALSVVRAAAVAAGVRLGRIEPDAADRSALAEVICAAAGAASEALRRTPEQLNVLARAGVVDAGGWGVLMLLRALAEVVTGETAPGRPDVAAVTPTATDQPHGGQDPASWPPTVAETGAPGHGYEVQYLLDSTEDRVRVLRGRLGALGDCVAVVGTGEGTWNVHVHVDDVGGAIEAGIDAGRPSRITVERISGRPDHLAAGTGSTGRPTRAVVAVAPGEGLSGLFEAEGVAVVGTGPDRVPTVDEVLGAIVGTGATSVVVLPNHGAVTQVADRAARAARVRGVRIAVVPTRSPVQGLAAVAVHDGSRRFDDDVIAMAEAAAATHWAEVTVAARESLTMAGRCRAGDVLGLADGDVVLIGSSVSQVATELVDRMLSAGGELVTVILGARTGAELGRRLERHVASRYPAVEVRVYDGGQPHHPVILGVE